MKYKINLIPKKEKTLGERFLYFASHYLRYIIVITQLVVIGVFFYRFQVDQRVVDLKEAVGQKKEIIEIVLPLLTEANRIDQKQSEITDIVKEQDKFRAMFNYFLSLFPETITLTNLEVGAGSMKVTGNALNSGHLQAFFELLRRDGNFKTVAFQTINKTDVGYNFVLNLEEWKK